MKTIIAEKPSVARAIANLVGATQKMEGYLMGNGYFVTWAFGHLIALGMPEAYGISSFDSASLPILPHPFVLTVRKIKKENRYITDTGAQKQLNIIKALFDKSESIIVATDAGREGELIFRYIYEYLKCSKPFERLWVSSLTEKAIKHGLENLKEGITFDGLYHAAKSRSRADWLIGINATQALSIAAGNGIYSLGRVQTPTLALVCKRYLENKQFEVKKYWQLHLLHSKMHIDFKSTSDHKWDDIKLANATLKAIQCIGKATVTAVVTQSITQLPPLLFDLTGLQKEANTKLNLSADETLHIAQSLYEKQFITYPRTGSKYIPEDVWAEIPHLVRALQHNASYKKALALLKWGRFSKHIVNDLRVTDHHGILFTEKIPSALNAKEHAVYNMIVFRLLEALSHACIKEITTVTLAVPPYSCTLKGCKITTIGWRAIHGHLTDESNEVLQDLPTLQQGDVIPIKDATVVSKQTQPPKLYTEAGLLAAMESAGKDSLDSNESKALLGIGIGTPATRATIIETLFARNYMQRAGKLLIPTEKGLQVYNLVKNKKIADVAMTAEWELDLQHIEHSIMEATTFLKAIEIYTSTITKEILQTTIPQNQIPELICPKCQKHVLRIRDTIVKCTATICGWVQFRKVCGILIGISDLEKLVNTGKTSLLKGMKSKAGKTFNAYIVLNDKAESAFEFEQSQTSKQ